MTAAAHKSAGAQLSNASAAGSKGVPFLPYGQQEIGDDDIASVVSALRAPQITQGPLVAEFEQSLGEYLGSPYVCAVSNGTTALQVAYAALGLGPGDEIITTPVTFAATANAARALGADVRFGDVDPATGNLAPASVEALITTRTKGIVAVHLAGLPADLAELKAIADRHGLWLIEDAAHALGATYQSSRIGDCRYSVATTFSFHPVKHLTTGEGGAVCVRDPALKRKMDRLRHHGITRGDELQESPGPWYYEVSELGWNFRLTDIQCALGISQLAKQKKWLAARRTLAATYGRRVASGLDGLVTLQAAPADRESAYHLLIALIDFAKCKRSKADVMRGLRERGIGTQVHYIPVNHHPYYRKLYGDPGSQPGVASFYDRALSLPMYPTLTDGDVARVVDALAFELGA